MRSDAGRGRRDGRAHRLAGLGLSACLAGLAAAAEPEPARTGPGAPDPARRPSAALTLYLYDVHDRLEPAFEVLARESQAIFRGMGIEVAWRRGAAGTTYGDGGATEIPVIVLDRPASPALRAQAVLGLVSRQAPVPAVWIFAENLRQAIGAEPRPALPAPWRELGVAAGRVIAHEVVHALAPDLPHSKEGLMRKTLGPVELTGPERPVSAECRNAVRLALGRAAAAARPGSAAVGALALLAPFPPRH